MASFSGMMCRGMVCSRTFSRGDPSARPTQFEVWGVEYQLSLLKSLRRFGNGIFYANVASLFVDGGDRVSLVNQMGGMRPLRHSEGVFVASAPFEVLIGTVRANSVQSTPKTHVGAMTRGWRSLKKLSTCVHVPLFKKASRSAGYSAINARYFYGVCLYRERDWIGTVRGVREFAEDRRREPMDGRGDTPLVTSSKKALKSLGSSDGGLASIVWVQLKRAIFD